jgi:GNAT superfamily N-acetyltransferase
MPEQQFQWRGHFDNYELNVLHAEAFAHPTLDIDWTRQVRAHSLGWVTARESRKLVGFVNVAWDGDVHAFILDTIVIAERRRHGIGTRLVSVAVDEARSAGCEWLHVDFDEDHKAFYLNACGFEPAAAGLMPL